MKRYRIKTKYHHPLLCAIYGIKYQGKTMLGNFYSVGHKKLVYSRFLIVGGDYNFKGK